MESVTLTMKPSSSSKLIPPGRRRFNARFRELLALPILLLGLFPNEALADDSSLENLGDTPAILSSKPIGQLFDAPTGSYVFDEEAIDSLPVDSIAEMLRYAPGVHIIRPSNGIWGIGMRGINSRFFNRVQFSVDEQNVYSSIFAGLFGNQHDLLMSDVASVEVAYGPGGGTWDNNAVNGRINVLMKTAFETEGDLLQARIGTESRGIEGRHGWMMGESAAARVYFKANQRDSSDTRFDYSNKWDAARSGFRLDKRLTSIDLLSVSAEAFYSDLGYAYNLADFQTGDLSFQADSELLRGVSGQAKWTRNTSRGDSYSVRGWITYSDLDAAYAAFGMGTGGIEGRGRFRVNDSHVLNYNIGGAYDQEHTRATQTSDWSQRFLNNFSAYAGFQDEWMLVPNRLNISWGVDFRYEDKSDTSIFMPNARAIYELSDNDRLWASYSSAKRNTPVSLVVIESLRSGKAIEPPLELQTPFGDFSIDRNLTNAISNRELAPETLDAFEAGYRRSFSDERGALSINGYYYQYDDIFARIGLSAQPNLFAPQPYLNVQGGYDNLLDGEAFGFETALNWNFDERTSIALTYSYLDDSFDPIIPGANPFEADSILFSQNEFDHSSPDNMATLNLSTDLSDQWNLNTGLRYTSSYAFAKGKQPSIFQADTRLSWTPRDGIRFSLVGRNLLDSTTEEARLKDFFGHWTRMKREVYLEARAEF